VSRLALTAAVTVIESAETGELLTILHTVDQRKVPAEEWAALWGINVEAVRAWRRELAIMTGTDCDKDGPL
jgi:hypothetical protein